MVRLHNHKNLVNTTVTRDAHGVPETGRAVSSLILGGRISLLKFVNKIENLERVIPYKWIQHPQIM